MNEIDLAKIGGCVAIERPNGQRSMCSWVGETVEAWVTLDEDHADMPIGRVREHVVSALPIDSLKERPAGYFAATFFVEDGGK